MNTWYYCFFLGLSICNLYVGRFFFLRLAHVKIFSRKHYWRTVATIAFIAVAGIDTSRMLQSLWRLFWNLPELTPMNPFWYVFRLGYINFYFLGGCYYVVRFHQFLKKTSALS